MENNLHSHERPTWFGRLLALVGSIIVIIIVLWGLVNIANLMSPWITSFFPKTSTTSPSANTLPKANITKIQAEKNKYSNDGSVKEGTVIKNNTSRAPAPNNPADFSVRIIAVGIIDPSTGAFVARTPSTNDMTAVQFDIGNIGGKATGSWHFTATLPTQDGYIYTSSAQEPLAPESHIVNTLRFTDLSQSGGMFSVHVNPDTNVREPNESNNYAEQFIQAVY